MELWIYITHKNNNEIQIIEKLSLVSTIFALSQLIPEREFSAVDFKDANFL